MCAGLALRPTKYGLRYMDTDLWVSVPGTCYSHLLLGDMHEHSTGNH